MVLAAFDEVERKPNFACDAAELVSLCKAMFWKTHIPVRTQKMATPLNFCKGMAWHSY